jgi:methyl-accepting chemotaxis protein
MKLTFFRKNIAIALTVLSVILLETVFLFYSQSNIRQTSNALINKDMAMLNMAHEVKLSVVQVQQWLTDISATRGLDGLNDGFDEAAANAKKFRSLIEQLQNLDPANAGAYQAMLPVFENYYDAGRQMAQAYIDQGPAGGNAMMGNFDNAAAAMTEQVDTFLSGIIEKANDRGASQLALVDTLGLITIVATLCLFASIALAFYQGRALQKFLGDDPENLKRVVDNISRGDLTATEIRSNDNSVYSAIHQMQQRLSRIIEHDIQTIMNAANAGDLSKRIDTDDKPGFYQHLCQSINDLVENNQHIIDDTARVFAALEHGDLTQTIKRPYRGSFNQLKTNANATVERLQHIISHDIQDIIRAVTHGELERRIDTRDHKGFFADISEGINQLVDSMASFIEDIHHSMDNIASGDLTRPIDKVYSGRFSNLKDTVNRTIAELDSVLARLQGSASEVDATAREIADGNNQLASRTEHQASALEQINSSLAQLSATVSNNADNTSQAQQLAQDTRGSVEKGGDVMKKAYEAMQEINSSSQKIAEIIGVIDEIAFQTNLLALNASVEAARAGEQGRGFAVVATEVRNLAGRTATSAREIKELIVDSVHKVEIGVDLVNESSRSQQEIARNISQVSTLITEISTSSIEQSHGIEQVNGAVSSMDSVTQQNTALVEETSASALNLTQKADELRQIMGFFKVSGRDSMMAPPKRATSPSIPARTSQSGSGHTALPRPTTSSALATASKARPTETPLKTRSVPETSTQAFEEDDWEEF